MKPSARTERRIFAVTSLGRGRWYWVVWPSLVELQAADEPLFIIADGTDETKESAVEQALNMAGRYARLVAAKFVRDHHDRYVGEWAGGKGAGSADASGAPAPQTFLYREIYDPIQDAWVYMPH